MDKNINPNQHAYLIEGEKETAIPLLENAIKEIFGVKIAGNPDCRISHFETLGIDEARGLKEEQSRRAFGGAEKFFVISADSVTREAQNALLKVFEEPTEGTYLFLAVPSLRQILPTLLSRVRVIKSAKREARNTKQKDAESFLAATAEKRLQLPFMKKMLEDKEKQAVVSFFNELEAAAREKLPAGKMTKADTEFFTELIKCRGYAGDRASSVKMLLEHVALITPKIV